MTETAKKSLLYNAVEHTYPEIITAENLANRGRGGKYTYNELKDLIFQIDNSRQKVTERTAFLGDIKDKKEDKKSRSSGGRSKSKHVCKSE